MTVIADGMVQRLERRTDAPDDYTYDILYVDRLTGRVIMRYDGADPANTNPAYGARSDEEYLNERGFSLNDEVPLSQCKVRVNPAEVERWAARKQAKADREREEAEARDLLDFLGDDAADFSFDDWRSGELEILLPALKSRGFTEIGFYMAEQDSFGPLIRGCVARDPEGTRVRFFYG